MAAGPRGTYGIAILFGGRGPSRTGRSRFTKRRLAGAIIAAGPAVRLHVPRRAISLARGPPTPPTAVPDLHSTPWSGEEALVEACCEDARHKARASSKRSRPKLDPRVPPISFFSSGSRGKAHGMFISVPGSQGWSHLLRMDAVKRLVRRRISPEFELRGSESGRPEPENRPFHRARACDLNRLVPARLDSPPSRSRASSARSAHLLPPPYLSSSAPSAASTLTATASEAIKPKGRFGRAGAEGIGRFLRTSW